MRERKNAPESKPIFYLSSFAGLIISKLSSLKSGIVNNELFRGDIKSICNEFGTFGEMQ